MSSSVSPSSLTFSTSEGRSCAKQDLKRESNEPAGCCRGGRQAPSVALGALAVRAEAVATLATGRLCIQVLCHEALASAPAAGAPLRGGAGRRRAGLREGLALAALFVGRGLALLGLPPKLGPQASEGGHQ